MQAAVPRALGVLALLWAVRGIVWPPGSWDSAELYEFTILTIAVAGSWLVVGRSQVVGAALLLVGTVVYVLAEPTTSVSPVALLAWMALIVMVTDQNPQERALLLRVCVSCVYGFTALAKLNPSFLDGDQIYWIAATRDQMAWSMDLAVGWPGVVAAWCTVALEGWLAIGLWFARTRRITAVIGVMLHLVLVPVASMSWDRGVLFLLVLNGGLVAMYPAFWHSIPVHRVASEPEETHQRDGSHVLTAQQDVLDVRG